MKDKTKIGAPDYKRIRELSRCIDCTITDLDFNTNFPNSCRLNYIANDIHRYLKRTNKESIL